MRIAQRANQSISSGWPVKWVCVGLVVFASVAWADAGPIDDAGTAPSTSLGASGVPADLNGPALDLPTDETKGEELNLGWALFRTALVLGIVVSLIYLTLNVGLRKLLGLQQATALGLVKVLERVPLDQKRTLFVVRAGQEVLLLGASENSLELITKMNAEQVALAQPLPAAAPTLSPLLQKLLGPRKKS